MNTYENEIKETESKIAELKKSNKGHSANTMQTDLNQLHKAIKKGDEAAAEKAVTKLMGKGSKISGFDIDGTVQWGEDDKKNE